MSAEIFRLELVRGVRENTKDTATNIEIEADTFNKYLNPISGDFLNEQCTAIHGLHPTHKSKVYADPMAIVWRQFEEWIQSIIGRDDTAILVAYNGKKCDLLWI